MDRSFRTVMLAVLVVIVCLVGIRPDDALANFNNYKNADCFSCHVNDATGITTASNANLDFKLAVNGTDIPITITAGTSTFDSPTVNVTAGTTAQIDFYQRNVRGTSDTTLGYTVVTPAASTNQVDWLLSQGAVGTAPAGWNATVFNAFQNDTGEVTGWVNTNFNDGAKPTPAIHYNEWIQEYSSGGVGTKAEGDEGGTDFGIAVPAAASGPYVLQIYGIGHDDAGGRHAMLLNINLNVTAGGGDTTAPATVSDLSTGTVTASSVALSWTAPGDDNTTGTATSYDVRYSTVGPITDGNWAAATPATGEPAPSIAGTTENFTVTGLSAGTQYWFALQTSDEVPNTSLTSNSPTATTSAACVPAPPTVSVAPSAQTIPNDGGLVVYTVTVTNNDSATCASSSFSLSANDTNPGDFYASYLSKTSMTLAASGGSDSATLTVQVLPGLDAVSNNSTVTATDSPTHDPPVSSTPVTTSVTLGGGCVSTGSHPNVSAGGTLILGH